MRRYYSLTTILALIGLILACGLLAFLSRQGRRQDYEARRKLEDAQQHWQSGQTVPAVLAFVHGHQMAVETEIRWIAAQPFFKRSSQLYAQREFEAARDWCFQAARLLRIDPEGAYSYQCFVIEERIWMQEQCQHECHDFCRQLQFSCPP